MVWKNKINENNTIVVLNNDRGSKFYVLNKNGLYEEEKNERAENEEWRGCLIASRGEKHVKVLWSENEHNIKIEIEHKEVQEYNNNKQLLWQCIVNRKAHAACDGSEKSLAIWWSLCDIMWQKWDHRRGNTRFK